MWLILHIYFSIYLLSFKNSILFFFICLVEIFCFFIEIVLNMILSGFTVIN